MKTWVRWSLALGSGLLGMAAFAAPGADEGLLFRLAELRAAAASDAPFKFSPELCARLPSLQAEPPAIAPDNAPLLRVLAAVSSRNGLPAATVLPGRTEAWWRRFQGQASALLGLAVHEVLHELNTVQRKCHDDRPSYFVEGRVHRVDRHPAYRSPYAQVASWFEARPITVSGTFQLYIARGGLAPGNDFYVLLDEWASYLGGSEAELNLVGFSDGQVLYREGVTRLKGSLDGALHFKLYALVYLDMLCQDTPGACPSAPSAPKGLREFLQVLLTLTDERLAWRQRVPVWQHDLLQIDPAVLEELQEPALVALEQRLREP